MDSPPQLGMTPLLRRQILENPECYPCWSGVTITADYSAPKYTPRGGCDKRCCINPPITPAGEDTPGWAARVAAEEEEDAFQQPDFDAAADSPNNYSPSQATAEELLSLAAACCARWLTRTLMTTPPKQICTTQTTAATSTRRVRPQRSISPRSTRFTRERSEREAKNDADARSIGC